LRENEMPLLPGKANIGHNISEMENSGHPHNQAVAAALNEARKSGANIPRKGYHDVHKIHHKPRGHVNER
jgi:hypothetical protein